MKINEIYYGFRVTEIKRIGELDCDLYVLKYEKNGARLVFLDRDDENKTFSIAFKTVPEDSTGVFHILEHSVLCGSEKFPLKDPFVELLKGSLNTFLNAMTFQDKTMYPVSSRNDKDFFNLVNIYMDAVLHPLAVKSPNAFYQEGWHYEISEEGELSCKGVVLNEMKGEYSSADAVCERHMNAMLYPDTCYAEDSGGDPGEIVKLTYENFKAAHKRYYHPSAAELFLDGSVNLDEILSLLDSYLKEYDYSDVNDAKPIKRRGSFPPASRTVEYEIPADQSPKNKTRVSLGYVFANFSEQEKLFATSALFSTLFSNNESPAKKAILDTGICEELTVSLHDGILEPSATVEFINVRDGRADEAEEIFYSVIKNIAKKGINREQLTASLYAMEFKLRERDYGTLPLGVVNAMISLESILYSNDPGQNLCYEKSLKNLHSYPDAYYKKLLLDIFVNNEKRAKLIMLPSGNLGERREREEKQRLQKVARDMTDTEKEEIFKLNRELLLWQSTEDTEEAKSTVAHLSVSDISGEVKKTEREIFAGDGFDAVIHDINTRGIVYTDLYFDVSDIDKGELLYLFLFGALLTNLPTEKHSALEIQSMIKSELGAFDAHMTALTKDKETKIYFQVSVSALESRKEKIKDIAEEILNFTKFDDELAIKNYIKQTIVASEDSFASSGHQTAISRAAAATSVEAAVREYYSGYEAYLIIKDLDKNFEEKKEGLKACLCEMLTRFICRERLTVSISGCNDKEFINKLASLAKKGGMAASVCNILPLPKKKEGIEIPAQVGFAAISYNLNELGEIPTGSFDVVRNLVGYEYLWGEIRVKGGAYGAGMVAGISGNVGFYSYRDPTPKRTLSRFAKVPSFLLDFAEGENDISNYIIGAIGDSEPIRTPRMRSTLSMVRYLRGIDSEREQKNRSSILNTDSEELRRISKILEKCIEGASVCVVGGKETLEAMRDELDVILKV